MIKVDLAQGTENDGDGAVDLAVLQSEAVSISDFMKALVKSLEPFTPFIRDGYGIAITIEGEEAGIIGVKL